MQTLIREAHEVENPDNSWRITTGFILYDQNLLVLSADSPSSIAIARLESRPIQEK